MPEDNTPVFSEPSPFNEHAEDVLPNIKRALDNYNEIRTLVSDAKDIKSVRAQIVPLLISANRRRMDAEIFTDDPEQLIKKIDKITSQLSKSASEILGPLDEFQETMASFKQQYAEYEAAHEQDNSVPKPQLKFVPQFVQRIKDRFDEVAKEASEKAGQNNSVSVEIDKGRAQIEQIEAKFRGNFKRQAEAIEEITYQMEDRLNALVGPLTNTLHHQDRLDEKLRGVISELKQSDNDQRFHALAESINEQYGKLPIEGGRATSTKRITQLKALINQAEAGREKIAQKEKREYKLPKRIAIAALFSKYFLSQKTADNLVKRYKQSIRSQQEKLEHAENQLQTVIKSTYENAKSSPLMAGLQLVAQGAEFKYQELKQNLQGHPDRLADELVLLKNQVTDEIKMAMQQARQGAEPYMPATPAYAPSDDPHIVKQSAPAPSPEPVPSPVYSPEMRLEHLNNELNALHESFPALEAKYPAMRSVIEAFEAEDDKLHAGHEESNASDKKKARDFEKLLKKTRADIARMQRNYAKGYEVPRGVKGVINNIAREIHGLTSGTVSASSTRAFLTKVVCRPMPSTADDRQKLLNRMPAAAYIPIKVFAYAAVSVAQGASKLGIFPAATKRMSDNFASSFMPAVTPRAESATVNNVMSEFSRREKSPSAVSYDRAQALRAEVEIEQPDLSRSSSVKKDFTDEKKVNIDPDVKRTNSLASSTTTLVPPSTPPSAPKLTNQGKLGLTGEPYANLLPEHAGHEFVVKAGARDGLLNLHSTENKAVRYTVNPKQQAELNINKSSVGKTIKLVHNGKHYVAQESKSLSASEGPKVARQGSIGHK